jgi:hypothetical protein
MRHERYRVEREHGRFLLCGGYIPADMVKPGQRWARADGINRVVTVIRADPDWVTYQWLEATGLVDHMKSNTGFQARYCLVLDNDEIPRMLR